MRKVFSFITKGNIVVSVALILTVMVVAYRIYLQNIQPERYADLTSEEWKDLEVKKGLKVIYDALQLYHTYTRTYPDYIWGGSLASWEGAVSTGLYDRIYDPLISQNILSQYPKNPYWKEVNDLCQESGFDPRFGCQSTSSSTKPVAEYMGNILSDNRIRSLSSPPRAMIESLPELYYIQAGSKGWRNPPFRPGLFGYRSLSSQHFILFAYGGKKHQGLDILSWELGQKERRGGLQQPPNAVFPFPLKEGKPIGYGHPDGIPDGIILVYTQDGILMEGERP